jgi:hypothetical protein
MGIVLERRIESGTTKAQFEPNARQKNTSGDKQMNETDPSSTLAHQKK